MSSIHSSLRDSADDLGLLTEELLPQFHPGQNGGRISLLLTEAEDLKKRWVKKQQLEPCMEQLIGSGLRKEYDRAICCHPVCLTYTLNTS